MHVKCLFLGWVHSGHWENVSVPLLPFGSAPSDKDPVVGAGAMSSPPTSNFSGCLRCILESSKGPRRDWVLAAHSGKQLSDMPHPSLPFPTFLVSSSHVLTLGSELTSQINYLYSGSSAKLCSGEASKLRQIPKLSAAFAAFLPSVSTSFLHLPSRHSL